MDSFLERRRSRTLRKTVSHRCLRLGWTEDGPTELGGLVLRPEYRGHAARLGHWLSYARLIFIAARRRRFRSKLLAEYLPVFLKGGRSPFWEFFGRKFTGLSYRSADKLSIDNKEFIVSLFPDAALYTDLFPSRVLSTLGQVGDPTKPAARMLEKMGFRYNNQIEPFDGGPYYEAETDAVPLVRAARRAPWRAGEAGGVAHLLLHAWAGGARALVGPAVRRGGSWTLEAGTAARLELSPGCHVWGARFSP
jgi:arginine N-succinyltransferase